MAARMAKPNADAPPISRVEFVGVHQGNIVASSWFKRFRPHRRLATCSHGTPRSALLCQGCVNRSFKLLKQSQGFRIGERQELHQNDARYAPIEIDPEIGISEPRPGETSGTASTEHGFGRDHKAKPPLLDHAGKEFSVVRQVRDHGSVAQHVLVTVPSLPPRRGEQPYRSVFGCSCCLRPSEVGSALGATFFEATMRSLLIQPGDSCSPLGRSCR